MMQASLLAQVMISPTRWTQRLANLYEVKVNQEAQSRQMQILNFRDYQFPKLTLKANSQSILQIQ